MAFPFEWWIVTIVTLAGTILWAGAMYYYSGTYRAKEEAKPRS